MKKSKILALALAAGITLMGAGYAVWTDKVTATNKVETGYLSVEVVSDGYGAEVTEANYHQPLQHTVTWTPTVNADNKYKSGTMKVSNLYDGAIVKVTIPVKNTGSIPVVFDPNSTTVDINGTTMTLTPTDVTFIDYGPDGVIYNDYYGWWNYDGDNILDCEEGGVVTYTFTVGEVEQSKTGDNAYSFTVIPGFKQWNK